jgi:AcrR family transcriptional regulator
MPRWEQGSKERLQQAAMELFEEQGFEDTTAVQIAKRARVTTRTFFRYFADKQEVLFADEDMLRAALVAQVRQAADVTAPLEAVAQSLAGFDWGGLGSRAALRRREAMIASTPCLLERELIKQHQMAEEFGDILLQRGLDPDVAGLAAHVGVHVFRTAYRQWLADDTDADLKSAVAQVMSCLATVVPATKAPTTRRRDQPRKPSAASQTRRRSRAAPLR